MRILPKYFTEKYCRFKKKIKITLKYCNFKEKKINERFTYSGVLNKECKLIHL